VKELNKIETAAAFAAVRAVINSQSGVPKDHPLETAALKLEANLEEFNATQSR
jgi:hypothetical protein